jgi:Carboxypeptidase regulatory-like domain
MSYSDRTPRDRPKAHNLALWAASILVALLTGCSAVQPVPGGSAWSAFEVHGAEHYAALDATVSGHALDQAGEALSGVYIYIRPESGDPYQTTTGEDGSYSLSVPEGNYQIFAEYNPNDEPGGGVYLEPTEGVSITITSSAEVDFRLP